MTAMRFFKVNCFLLFFLQLSVEFANYITSRFFLALKDPEVCKSKQPPLQ